MRAVRRQLPLVLSLLPLAGCSVVNAIDVCDRGQEDERPLNQRSDGDQFVLSSNAIAALPGGSALVAFTSYDGSGDVGVRWRRVGAGGVPHGTCDAEAEYAYDPPSGGPVPEFRFGPIVAGPQAAGDRGLVLFTATDAPDGDVGRQLWAQPIDTTPCPEDDPVVVRDPGAGEISAYAVVGLDDEKFVVLWQEEQAGSTPFGGQMMARVLQMTTFQLEVLPTTPAPDGEAVPISVEDRVVIFPAAVATGDLELAAAWLGIGGDEVRVWLAVLDDRLVARVPPRVVARHPRGGAAIAPHLGLATDGAGLLVVWSVDVGDGGQAFALRLDLEGDPIGVPMALGTGESIVEDAPVAVGMADGGYLVAWHAHGNPQHDDRSGSGIRAMALGRDGAPRFLNPACGAGEFQLNRVVEDDQVRPALARLRDGSLLSVWADYSAQLDPDGSGVAFRLLRPRDLLPLE